jgi:putative FmdB family regulatory protein
MPIFEYRCQSCGNLFEKIVYGAAVASCPSCGGADLEKLISSFAVSSASSAESRSFDTPAACGTCGDPRGAGACTLDYRVVRSTALLVV